MALVKHAVDQQSTFEIETVEEKILLEKQLPFDPGDKKGPTTDLYFHELTAEKSAAQKILRYVTGTVLGIFFIATLPVIGLFIKLLTNGPIFQKRTVPGRRDIIFQQYLYSTTHSKSNKAFRFGSFLRKSKLEKLPSIINIWKREREMNLIGPTPYPAEWCNKWNKHLSDYYKRFALNPGLFSVTDPITDPRDIDDVATSLDQEIKYILNPSFKKDLANLL